MADSREKRELIAQIDRARSRATAFQRELKEDVKIGQRVHEVGDQVKSEFKESVDHHRGIWLGAAAVVGLLISKIPPRTKVIMGGSSTAKKEAQAKKAGAAGLLVAALGWVFSLVRPLIFAWGRKRIMAAVSGQQRYPRI